MKASLPIPGHRGRQRTKPVRRAVAGEGHDIADTRKRLLVLVQQHIGSGQGQREPACVSSDVGCPENTEIKSPLIADTSRLILGLEAKDDQQGGLLDDGRDVSAGCVQEGHCT